MPPTYLPPSDPPAGPPAGACERAPSGSAGLLVEVEVLRHTVARISDELTGLRRAMASRSVIDQAKGAVRAAPGLTEDEAFALLAARSQNANRKLSDVASDVLASTHPDHTGTPVLRSRTQLVLSRADLTLRYPDHPRPECLVAVAVLPAATDSADPVAWPLYFDHVLPPDRSLRAMLDCAARLATGALTRAG